ncbi:unnamed protein product [Dibothriocephalus latus]|uniref:Uncharacterized protein n=1 Tax=Dibothriocephalus latus TaxID=60516 RepID=A0A3P6P977_DIBLA|nr:unnamed protein product [Dibothriocephalus latus]
MNPSEAEAGLPALSTVETKLNTTFPQNMSQSTLRGKAANKINIDQPAPDNYSHTFKLLIDNRGHIFDVFATYTPAMLLAACLSFTGFLLFVFLNCIRPRASSRQKDVQVENVSEIAF